ncbi:GNAT family N-acetyltransferase [Herbaspirillum chlorophenolicum]|uniref:GNAT family N-acetyltransferase n=1 Tax=Herbaspirillum chlorophenolicum TaxID=211589 RepID=A0ABW8EV49_9BURK
MIKTTYLKIGRKEFLLNQSPFATMKLSVTPISDERLCAELYAEVGAPHYWNVYRVCWDLSDWQHYACQPNVQISQFQLAAKVVGYLELRHSDDAVEIVNFGLRPNFVGRGVGRAALEAALAHGFSFGVSEIWLHTCSLDHPAALSNYYARGFRLIKEDVDNFLPLDPIPGIVQLAA